MSTTISAIRTALAAVITGLTPGGTAHGRSSYVQASEYHPFEAEAGVDREFFVGEIQPGRPLSIGLTTQSIIETDVEIYVGHWKQADIFDAIKRKDTDLYQITRAVESKANYPSGVSLIRLTGSSSNDRDEWWETTMRFRLLYDGAL